MKQRDNTSSQLPHERGQHVDVMARRVLCGLNQYPRVEEVEEMPPVTTDTTDAIKKYGS